MLEGQTWVLYQVLVSNNRNVLPVISQGIMHEHVVFHMLILVIGGEMVVPVVVVLAVLLFSCGLILAIEVIVFLVNFI